MQMQFGNVVAQQSGGVWEGLPQQHQWWPNYHPPPSLVQIDERDAFISWLRGEFAAANAMINALCHHLWVVGDPGEYDEVIGCVQQRRNNWHPVLHRQPYYVDEVVYALQQVGFRKNQRHQQRMVFEGTGKVEEYRHRRCEGGRGGHKSEGGFRDGKEGHHRQNYGNFDAVSRHKEMNGNQNLENGEVNSKNDFSVKPEVDSSVESTGSRKAVSTELAVKPEVDSSVESIGSRKAASTGFCNEETDTHSESIAHKENYTAVPKTFVADRIVEGKTVNEVDGLKLFEELFNCSEVSKLVTLVNDLRLAGRRGQLQGQTFVGFKRPMNGHGREMIQFGLPIADAPLEVEVVAGNSKDWKIEPIPSLFEDVIERLVTMEIVSEKPDCCMIDFFDEGDHLLPQQFPYWYGRPVCVLSLTECDMTFGKVIMMERPGDFIGSLKLSLTPGSMLALEGRSSDFAKHAIPSTSKQRKLVTFAKSMPKKVTSSDAQQFPAAAAQIPSHSHWVPPLSRSPNHIRQSGPEHYGPVPTSGVLPALWPCIQTIFVPAAVAPAIPFPALVPLHPASTGWMAAPPRHSTPSLPVAGTGVFLPRTGVFLPGAGNSANQSLTICPTNDNNTNVEARTGLENQEVNLDVYIATSKGTNDDQTQHQECDDTIDGSNSLKNRLAVKEEHQPQEPIGAVSS